MKQVVKRIIAAAVATLLPAMGAFSADAEKKTAKIPYGTAHIDGIKDEIYSLSPLLKTEVFQLGGEGTSTAVCSVLWNDFGLSIFAEVTEATPDSSSTTLSDRDSLEIFIDENNARTETADSDDAQYRVGYDGTKSCGMKADGIDSFMGVSTPTETGYNVEMYIPFKSSEHKAGEVMGFEIQVNNGEGGKRVGISKWCDPTGDSWKTSKNFGEIELAMVQNDYSGEILVALNGKRILFENNVPALIDGRVLVPLRAIFESMGAEIAWYNDIQTVYAIGNNTLIKLKINSVDAQVGGKNVKLDVPAKLIDGSTYVPVRFIGESFGAKVEWNGEKSLVNIRN